MLRLSRAIRLAKPPSATARTATRCSSTLRGRRVGGTPAEEPGSTSARAEATSSGLWSRFFGYASSSELTDFDGADEETRWAPAAGSTTISLQPIRPA